MANASTGIVVTAGALSLADLILSGWNPQDGIRISVATVLAALASAGLDRVVPGLGTGLASVALVSVLFTSGPRVVKALDLS